MTDKAPKLDGPRLGYRARALFGICLAALVGPGPLSPASRPVTLVVCAPGYPGSTVEAQPAMDALASAAASASGWRADELSAVYYETEEAGLARLAAPDAALALVPLPFWLKHREALQLTPFLEAVPERARASEPWSLVVPAGVSAPADLAGYEIVSVAGYAPGFVRGPALASWGALPRDLKVSFSSAVLTALRKASGGAKVAVLLDGAQAAAMPALPYASKLKVVARSRPWPVSVLCTVGGRITAARLPALVRGLTTLRKRPEGAEALAGVRLARFVAADKKALDAARVAFDRVEK